jgi:hypothetical protein
VFEIIFQATSNLAQGFVVPIQTLSVAIKLSLNVFTPHIVSAQVVCTNQVFVFGALSQVLVQVIASNLLSCASVINLLSVLSV